MSIRAGSRPKWLYWPKDGYWQFHVSWFRLDGIILQLWQ
jgi:hypothetical protein